MGDGEFVGDECLALLSDLIGQTVRRVRRINWDFHGDVDFDRGDLEITADRSVVWFDQAADGSQLRGRRGPWVDPFEGSSPEFAEQYGHFSPIDVTESPEYESIIGHEVASVSLLGRPILSGRFTQIFGFDLATRAGTLRAWVSLDEFYVGVSAT